MNSFYRIISAAALMIIAAAIPILLFSGVIKIPFTKIPVFNEKTEEKLPTTEKDPSTAPSTGEISGETPNTIEPPETAAPPNTEDIIILSDAEIALKALAEEVNGMTVTDACFDAEKHILVLADTSSFVFPDEFSYGKNVREFYLRSDTKKENLQTVTSVEPAVRPRMGFVFVTDSEGKVSLYYNDGTLLYESIPEDLVFMGARDENDDPVFKQGKKYVYYSAQKGEFVTSPYDPARDYRGIEFDYPSYYGKTNNDIFRTVSGSNYWGYAKSNGDGVVGPGWRYRGAYAFRDGFGLCWDSKNRIHIHNDSGTEKFTDIHLLRPEHDGIENLGYYMFEYGLMRARLVTYDSKGNIETDREVILGKNGKEYHIAPDYNVVSYSDGVFLMEKNGLYGYMSHTGEWLCEPKYTYARPFVEGLGVIGTEGGRKGIMTTSGEWAVEPVFSQITDCSGGVIALYDKMLGHRIIKKVNIPSVTE